MVVWSKGPADTDFHVFDGRGHSHIIDSGWKDVADCRVKLVCGQRVLTLTGQQEPARLDDRTARRHRLHHQPGQLRPAPLRLNGLIDRVPGKNRNRLTSDGLRFAIVCTKLHDDRLLRPLLAADQPPAPPPIRKALRAIDTHIAELIDNARLPLNAA